MGVAKGMRCFVRCAQPESIQPPREQPHQRRIRQRLAPPRAAAADQEHKRARRFGRALMQRIPADRIQRARLVHVHDTLVPRLLPHTTRVIITFADQHPPPPIGDVGQLQPQHLARAQPRRASAEPSPDPAAGSGCPPARPPPARSSAAAAARQPHPHRAADRLLAARSPSERPVPGRYPRQRRIGAARQRILAIEQLRRDRPLEKARHRRQRPRHRRRCRQPALRHREREPKPLRWAAARAAPQPSQQLQRRRRAELLPPQPSLPHELQQEFKVIAVSRRRVRAAPASSRCRKNRFTTFTGSTNRSGAPTTATVVDTPASSTLYAPGYPTTTSAHAR